MNGWHTWITLVLQESRSRTAVNLLGGGGVTEQQQAESGSFSLPGTGGGAGSGAGSLCAGGGRVGGVGVGAGQDLDSTDLSQQSLLPSPAATAAATNSACVRARGNSLTNEQAGAYNALAKSPKGR